MKAPLINIRTLNLTVNILEAEAPAVTILPSVKDQFTEALKKFAPDSLTPPAIGEYWPGQGGLYAGIRQYPEGLCHVIFATEDIGRHAWSLSSLKTELVSKVDGRENDIPRLGNGEGFPAFVAASSHTADDHNDFCLPSIGELNHAWQYIPDSFAKEAYWSSSQRSANFAFYVDFDVGGQFNFDKYDELRVRPVRRLPIQ